MRLALGTVLWSIALLAWQTVALAQQQNPLGQGRPIPGSFSAGDRSEVGAVDPHDAGKPWDPNLSEIDQLDALIRYRAVTGADKRDCHYGPVERRISPERLQILLREFESMPPAEAFEALLAEPEEPNVAPIPITLTAPHVSPAPQGLHCPDGDVTAQLLARRQQLQREGQVASQAVALAPRETSRRDPAHLYPTPMIIKVYGPEISELHRTEAIMRNRAAKGLDRLPDCYYGPIQLRIPLARIDEYLKQKPDLSGEEYWSWLMQQPEDQKEFPLTILVRSGTLPDCPAGDVDKRLRERRDQLLRQQATQ